MSQPILEIAKLAESSLTGERVVLGKDICTLIVEDDASVRELMIRLVRPHTKVDSAASATEALAKITDEKSEIDILFLDWVLGSETAELILDTWVEHGGGPVCVYTGSSSKDEMRILFAKGAYNVIEKPVEPEVILGVLRHYVLDVSNAKQLRQLQTDVTRLKQYILAMALALVGMQGLPQLYQLLQSLGVL